MLTDIFKKNIYKLSVSLIFCLCFSLKTVGDKQLCADPTMQWVKKIIESIQSKNATTPRSA